MFNLLSFDHQGGSTNDTSSNIVAMLAYASKMVATSQRYAPVKHPRTALMLQNDDMTAGSATCIDDETTTHLLLFLRHMHGLL